MYPPPVVQGVTVSAQLDTRDGQFGTYYTYTYTVTNPASNTGYIWNIQIDVSAPDTYQFNVPGDLTLPRGGLGTVEFFYLQNETLQNNQPSYHENVVPFGIEAPDGWVGSLTVNQTGGFWAGDGTVEIGPGQSATGLTMIGGVPTIRTMSLIPDWIPTFGDGEASDEDAVKARQIQDAMVLKAQVVAPGYVSGNSYDHWNQLKADMSAAQQLGWITDPTFETQMQADLQAARSAMDANGAVTALPALQKMLVDLQASTSAQRNDEAYGLILYNVQDIVAAIPPDDTPAPPPPAPKTFFINPSTNTVTAAVGDSVTVTAKVIDQANGDAPIAGYQTQLKIEGVDSDQQIDPQMTDASGQVTQVITGEKVGMDNVQLPFAGQTHELRGGTASVNIIWNGGPDLAVTKFRPPVIVLNSQPFEVSDTTTNLGNTVAPPTSTYYLLADSFPVEASNTFYIVDWRAVPQLAPGESSTGVLEEDLTGIVPDGKWYLIACANWDRQIAETDYTNNCHDGQLVSVIQKLSSGNPPVCSAAAPSANLLWPPNHKFVDITINGVTDPANLVPTITITGIQQDEPVNAKGDGNTAPDGAGIGTSIAQVRSERSGTAVGGRLYFISFSAKDSAGGSCTGTVAVGVPHDQAQHAMPTDNGQRYDSTALH
jgi:hypothetical protein